jgi:hypothetical protein
MQETKETFIQKLRKYKLVYIPGMFMFFVLIVKLIMKIFN